MKDINKFYEDLSDDFVDENTSVSSIPISKRLHKNMASNPLRRRIKSEDISESFSCELRKIEPFTNVKKQKSLDINAKCVKERWTPSRTSVSVDDPYQSKLQNDIKDLLQQAIKIRRSTRVIPSLSGTTKEINISPNEEIIVTVMDINIVEELSIIHN